MKTLKIKNLLKSVIKKANQLYDYLFDKMFGWIFTTEMSRPNRQHTYRINNNGLIVRIS